MSLNSETAAYRKCGICLSSALRGIFELIGYSGEFGLARDCLSFQCRGSSNCQDYSCGFRFIRERRTTILSTCAYSWSSSCNPYYRFPYLLSRWQRALRYAYEFSRENSAKPKSVKSFLQIVTRLNTSWTLSDSRVTTHEIVSLCWGFVRKLLLKGGGVGKEKVIADRKSDRSNTRRGSFFFFA